MKIAQQVAALLVALVFGWVLVPGVSVAESTNLHGFDDQDANQAASRLLFAMTGERSVDDAHELRLPGYRLEVYIIAEAVRLFAGITRDFHAAVQAVGGVAQASIVSRRVKGELPDIGVSVLGRETYQLMVKKLGPSHPDVAADPCFVQVRGAGPRGHLVLAVMDGETLGQEGVATCLYSAFIRHFGLYFDPARLDSSRIAVLKGRPDTGTIGDDVPPRQSAAMRRLMELIALISHIGKATAERVTAGELRARVRAHFVEQ